MQTRQIMVLFTAMLILAAGCGKKSSNEIKIASATPLSGAQSALGEDVKLGIEMAFNDQKADLEKLGFKLRFIPQDDQADPKVGVAVAQKLIADDDVLGVVGHWNSGVAIPSSEVYAKVSLCMVSPANTAVLVTDRRLPNVNRICARDDMQGPMTADFVVNDLAAKTIFVLHDKTTYGQGIADEFKNRAAQNGAAIIGYEGITQGESDFSAVLNIVNGAKPDAVYFGGIYPEASLLLKQMREKGISAKFIGPDGMDSDEVIKIAGESAIGAYYSSPAADITLTPEGKAWAERFQKIYGKMPGNWTVYGYDAMSVVLEAIKRAIAANNGQKPTREQVCAAVRSIQNFQGIVSTVSFDDKGDNKDAKLFIAEFKEAKYPPAIIKEFKISDLQK